MTASIPFSLSKPEIVFHGLANGTALMLLVSAFKESLKDGMPLVQASLALSVMLLSALIVLRRLKPENRGIRALEMLLSLVVAGVGAAAMVQLLALIVSGATYKGDSPDAGGMLIFTGLVLYYPAAAFTILPLVLKVSRLSRWVRRGLGFSVLILILLPFVLSTLARVR